MTRVQLIGTVIGAVGFALVIVNAGWLAALGVFLALWGYGIQLGGEPK
jgi:hypothetical protein